MPELTSMPQSFTIKVVLNHRPYLRAFIRGEEVLRHLMSPLYGPSANNERS